MNSLTQINILWVMKGTKSCLYFISVSILTVQQCVRLIFSRTLNTWKVRFLSTKFIKEPFFPDSLTLRREQKLQVSLTGGYIHI